MKRILTAVLRAMKNPHIIAAMTSVLALEHMSGVAMAQAVIDEIKGNGPEINDLTEWDRMVSSKIQNAAPVANFHYISEYGIACSPDDAPAGSIAVIPFLYPITRYDWWWAGTETKAAILNRCFANSNIIGVIQMMDTP